jgi:hypothetical protein
VKITMKMYVVLALVSGIIGCTSATLVKAPGSSDIPSEYSPLNKPDDNLGTVAYLNEGAKAVRDARRKDAYKKMYEACSGKYVLLGEGSSESNPTFTSYESTTFSTTPTTVYINFKCVSD